jgi:hypothetical protein
MDGMAFVAGKRSGLSLARSPRNRLRQLRRQRVRDGHHAKPMIVVAVARLIPVAEGGAQISRIVVVFAGRIRALR